MAGERRAATSKRTAELSDSMAAAVERALNGMTPDDLKAIRADPKLARAINEEAAVRAAAEYGVNIRRADGKIDMRLARQAAETAAIQSAAEMGFDIRSSSGGISRRKAYQAAKAADDARAGKPVSRQAREAVSRRDAFLAAAFRDAERRGFSIGDFGGDRSRRDAYDEARLAEIIRGHVRGVAR